MKPNLEPGDLAPVCDLSCGHLIKYLHHFRSEEDARQGCFRLLSPFSQCIVQQYAEVGLDDFEFGLLHRDRSGKIIDNVWAGFDELLVPHEE